MRSLVLLLAILFVPQAFATTPSTYGLKTGSKAPQIATVDVNGKSYDLHSELKKGPVVLIFYRGGWCPYCNLQLRNLEKGIAAEVKNIGASMVAISVDRIEEGLKTNEKEKLTSTIISDPDAKILDSYKVKFKVPEELVSKYKNEYKIDLEAASGRKHHFVAVPAVYVIDGKNDITYAFVDENYKVRAPEADIIKAVKSAKVNPGH